MTCGWTKHVIQVVGMVDLPSSNQRRMLSKTPQGPSTGRGQCGGTPRWPKVLIKYWTDDVNPLYRLLRLIDGIAKYAVNRWGLHNPICWANQMRGKWGAGGGGQEEKLQWSSRWGMGGSWDFIIQLQCKRKKLLNHTSWTVLKARY